MFKHTAYNELTGEVFTTTNARQLKKRAAQISRFNYRHYGIKEGGWLFSHNGKMSEKFSTPYATTARVRIR